jgi:hypothetical protein
MKKQSILFILSMLAVSTAIAQMHPLQEQYEEASFYRYNDSLFVVGVKDSTGKFGFVDDEGGIIIPIEFDEVLTYSHGRNGNEESYDYATPYGIVLRKGDKWGYLTLKGDTILPFEYDQIGTEHGFWLIDEGLLAVKKNDKWGMVNEKGELVIDFKYDCLGLDDCVAYFDHGLLGFYDKKWKVGYLDTKGKVIIKPGSFTEPIHLGEGYFQVFKKDRYGVINPEGKVIVPAKYDTVEPDEDDDGNIICFYAEDADIGTKKYDVTGKVIKE